MIFITVGTQKQQFTRLLELVENSVELKNEKKIAQIGHTKYESKKIETFSFISLEEIEKYIDEADLVISHGGVGTIFSGLLKHKKVLVVPRLEKYEEHINDHQVEISKELENSGHIIYYKDGKDSFDELVRKIKSTNLKEYKSDKRYLDILRKEI